MQVLGADAQHDDPWVTRAGGLARLRDPASPRIAEHVAALSDRTRLQLATVVLEEAISIGHDPDAALVERTAARLAAHRVRADLDPRGGLADVQYLLICDLEQLSDLAAAREVAATALAELQDDDQTSTQRIELLKAALRLARPGGDEDPVIQQAVTVAIINGAVLGLEARVWAGVNLLSQPGQRDAALTLTDQVTAELARLPGSDTTANQWRLLLAFHAGQAGYPAASQRLLAPVISSGADNELKAAQAVLRAISGPGADTRLQIIILEAELAATPLSADDELLRLHRTLARDHSRLGDFGRALQHGSEELQLSLRLLGPDHPQTLEARQECAFWTYECGDSAEALRLLRELLPDQIRVLGSDNLGVLATRGNIAALVGECGDSAGALRLFRELLRDEIRVLGRDHRHVLTSRGNIATWTGRGGDSGEALRLFRELLRDEIRVLGRDHRHVLTSRGNIATWTGRGGDSGEALRLFRELLPDEIRMLGRDHPFVLTTRNDIAAWTVERGDNAEGLRLFRELLPDQIRVLGRDHPDVLQTRANIAALTSKLGDHAEALRLARELLPDEIRMLGRDHPDVLATRGNIAFWTAECGDRAEALRLYRDLLPDRIRVLGRDHPDVLATRSSIAALAG